MVADATNIRTNADHGISLSEAFRVWLRVVQSSFGGPAGQVAATHRILAGGVT